MNDWLLIRLKHVHKLPEIMQFKKGLNVPKLSKNINRFRRVPSFSFGIIVTKMLIFEVRLPLKEPLVAAFGEKHALTSNKYVVVQGMKLLKSSKKHKYFGCPPPVLLQNNSLKIFYFEVLLPVREPSVTIFSEMHVVTLTKDIFKQGMDILEV